RATPVSVSYERQSLRVLPPALLPLIDNQCRKTRRNRQAASLALSYVAPPGSSVPCGLQLALQTPFITPIIVAYARTDDRYCGSAGADPRSAGQRSARRIVANTPVDRFPDEVGVAVVARVLLDHVEQDVAQAGGRAVRPAGPSRRSAVGHRRSEQRARAGHGVAPERVELFGGIIGGGAPVPRGVGAPVHGVPRWELLPPVQPLRGHVILEAGQVLEH